MESWAPEYGTPTEDGLGTSTVDVDAGAEVAADRWAPIAPAPSTPTPACIVFVDGVRRVDARVWINGDEGLRPGVCASYAAGAVRCDGRATLVEAVVERGVFCPGAGVDAIVTRHATYHPRPAAGETPEQLWLAVQSRMADLEAKAAIAAGGGADGGLATIVEALG